MAEIYKVNVTKFMHMLISFIETGDAWIDMEIKNDILRVRPHIENEDPLQLTEETIIKLTV